MSEARQANGAAADDWTPVFMAKDDLRAYLAGGDHAPDNFDALLSELMKRRRAQRRRQVTLQKAVAADKAANPHARRGDRAPMDLVRMAEEAIKQVNDSCRRLAAEFVWLGAPGGDDVGYTNEETLQTKTDEWRRFNHELIIIMEEINSLYSKMAENSRGLARATDPDRLDIESVEYDIRLYQDNVWQLTRQLRNVKGKLVECCLRDYRRGAIPSGGGIDQ